MSGLSNGVTPTGTTLGNSTFGTAGWAWTTTGLAAGMTGASGVTFPALPEPVLAGGVAYNNSGSLSMHCASSINAGGTATSCGSAVVSIPSAGHSVSVGFWYQTPNCNAFGSQDCGAMGAITGGTDYVNMHVNAGGNCYQNGLFLEGHGGNSLACLPFTNGATYRVNAQQNLAHAALTVTFSNGSPVISATNSLAANQAIKLTTTGTLPTNFNVQLSTGSYTSGGSGSGSPGQTCILSAFNGGGSGATGIIYIGGSSVLPSGSGGITFTNLGSGYTSAPTSATLSSGSATCSGTATISTTLATPLLFVSPTGLSGSQFELAAAQGGTPIVAGSAGSGTHTATQYDLLTVCQVIDGTKIPPVMTLVGTLFALAETAASQPTYVQTGVSGEGPTVAGYDFYWGGYVPDNAGKISLTECIL